MFNDEAGMVHAGLTQPMAAMNALALCLFAEGEAEWLSQDMPNLLGWPAHAYAQFATDYAAAFSCPSCRGRPAVLIPPNVCMWALPKNSIWANRHTTH